MAGMNGVVASPEPIAAEIGAQVLREGGNAADAGVAVALALAVTFPSAGNLGGGGFWMWRGRDRKRVAVDYREVAPRGVDERYFVPDERGVSRSSTSGWTACAVPGTPAGLWHVHRRFGSGRLSWARLVDPARALAEGGVTVTTCLSESIALAKIRLLECPAAAAIFLPGGLPPEIGSVWKQTDLARMLARFRDRGIDEYRTGEFAARICSASRMGGGLLQARDFLDYTVRERRPLEFAYRAHRWITMPPPSSGGIALASILGQWEPLADPRRDLRDPVRLHLLAETMRRAFADRAEYGSDPDRVPVPIRDLVSRRRADAWRTGIRLDRATPSARLRPVLPVPRESLETTHFTVVDSQGNAVSNTYTLNGSYGAAVVAPGTGVLMNNEMDDFATVPGMPNQFGLVQSRRNAVAPGKRPLSSMSPTIVEGPDGELRMAAGSPGGPTIINVVLQVLLNGIDHGLNVVDAVAAPRFHHQWMPDELCLESGLMSARPALERLGHKVVERALGDVQAVFVGVGGVEGASDPRHCGKTIHL